MSKNVQWLGNVLITRMSKTADDAISVATEMGLINNNMSLTPDSLQVDIPQGDYLIQAGQKVSPGDRVLLAWCQEDPVIIGPASEEATPLITVTSDGQGNVTIGW